MSKRQSVVYQATQILKKMEGFGTKRHADKKNAMNNKQQYDTYTKSKIYSYNTFKHTKNTVIPFVKFCREEYGIKYIAEIRSEYFTEFIKRGSVTGEKFEKNTAATYATHIKKFQNGFNKIYGTNIKFCSDTYKNYVVENKQVKEQMSKIIHDKIIERAYSTSLNNGRALELARNLGLRVGEITNLKKEDFKFKNDKLDKIHIHKSKGGRSRDIQAKSLSIKQCSKALEVYKYYAKDLTLGENIFKNKSKSYEKAFSRCRDWVISKLGLKEDYKYCGIHSMRKEFAKDFFHRETEENGRDPREVKEELTQVLGHNRLSVLNSYLS